MKDYKLTGYFSNGLLEKFEISYYVEYENEVFAKDDYDELIYSIPVRNDIKYSYIVKKNCLYTKLTYIIKYMDQENVKTMFESSKVDINKTQFEDYATRHGYTKENGLNFN